jgi:hypothetical protein
LLTPYAAGVGYSMTLQPLTPVTAISEEEQRFSRGQRSRPPKTEVPLTKKGECPPPGGNASGNVSADRPHKYEAMGYTRIIAGI